MRYLRILGDVVERRAGEVFLVDAVDGSTLTYGEAHERATRIARGLRARGLRPGDTLAIGAPNSVDLGLLYLAALYAGVVAAPIGSGFGPRELRSILTTARPRLVVTDETTRLATVAAEVGLEQEAVAAIAAGDGADEDWAPFDGVSSRDVVTIHFTSGTTGTPRGVTHRLSDFLGNAGRFTDACGLDERNRFYATLPMTYVAGYYNLLLLPFSIGASVVLAPAFDARSLLGYWDAAVEHDADTLWLVPTMMAMLLELDRDSRGREHCRNRVRFAAVGTAPLDASLRARFEESYGVTVHESYGLSETLLLTSSTAACPASPGAVGTVLPGVDIEIRSPLGQALAAGEEGAVFASSADTSPGYLGEQVSAGSVDTGWFDTGDIGVLDERGELRITGRAKDIIIRGGVNVSPAEVERALGGDESVERVAVVGVPHSILGEDLVAVVVSREGHAIEEIEQSLRRRAKAQLEPPQQPGVYLQIDELPTTPTGKVRKAALRALVLDQLGLPRSAGGFSVPDGDEERDSASPPAGALPVPGRIVDLSHQLSEGMTTFPSPNHPRPEITQLARHHVEGRETRRLVLGTHTGTHVDAPRHFVPGGGTVEALSLDALVGHAHVVDLYPVEALEEISLGRLREALGGPLVHPRVLLRYGWSARFGGGIAFYEGSPYLAREACRWLIDQGVLLLGMDTPSPDDPRLGFGSGDDSPNHKLLLGAGVILLEYLANLEQVKADVVLLAALPLPVTGADGAPARVVAIEA